MSRLAAFPEELLESILSYSLLPSSRPFSSSPLAVLLVCRSFYRISLPLYYHSISIHSLSQLQLLLALALRPNPLLATFIHHIVLPAIWPDAGELLYHCRHNLNFLDLTLDSVLNTQAHDPDPELFCRGLHELRALTHIVVRKPNNVYLTRPKLQYVLSEMTKAMHHWSDLEYVDLAFRLSDDSGGTAALLSILPIPLPIHHRPRSTKLPGPVTQLTQVLSSRPKLHTFSTHLPNVWNENILRVSQNPALHRIILVDGGGTAAAADPDPAMKGPGITGTGHFFAQARRYQRLSDLIRAGTFITRCRAQTTGRPWSYCGTTTTTRHQTPPSQSYYYRPHAHAHAHPTTSPSARSNNNNTWQISRSWELPSNAPSSSSTPGSTTTTSIPIHAPLPLSTSAP